ncbi:hypothetical protein J4482_04380 [Candidatus Woesearchaeota archaeon]|nr:hypothetical protein [Candidatus Woesearchaeota archaeon]
MAKKKQAKREAPARSESNSMGWIVAAIVVVVIIAFLVMKGGLTPSKSAEKPDAAPEQEALVASAVPPMEKKCTLAIGVVPGTKSVQGNNIAITFKNNGRVAMEGTYFEFSDKAGKVVYKKNADSVAAGATITYKVDLAQVSSEVGIGIKKFVIYPVQDGKACENQRNVIIDY